MGEPLYQGLYSAQDGQRVDLPVSGYTRYASLDTRIGAYRSLRRGCQLCPEADLIYGGKAELPLDLSHQKLARNTPLLFQNGYGYITCGLSSEIDNYRGGNATLIELSAQTEENGDGTTVPP